MKLKEKLKYQELKERIIMIDSVMIERPIGIGDVMRAMTNFQVPDIEMSLVGNPSEGLNGLLIFCKTKKKNKAIVFKLDRPLSQQSPDVIDFLYEILVNKCRK